VTKPSALVAVLAGGLGSRLGGDKAAVRLSGRPLLSYPLAAARAAGLPAVVVAKRGSGLPRLQAQVLHEPDEPRHPLCGLLAALEHAAGMQPPSAVLALPCDMPFLTGPLLAWLASMQGPVVLRAQGRLQPLPARCPPQALQVLAARPAGEPLGRALSSLEPRVVGEDELAAFGEPERLCFNVNDAGDLATAASWLAREAA